MSCWGVLSAEDVKIGSEIHGLLALPAGTGSHPTAVILHERYGLVQHTLDLAVRLAADGYATIAPDLMARYPDQEALHRGDVNVPLDDDQVCADIDASVEVLKRTPGADVGRLFVMGVCQSGRYPIVYAGRRRIAAAVAFYGGAQDRDWGAGPYQPKPYDEVLAALECPVLGVFGEDDHVVSIDNVLRLRNALERHRKSYEIRIFSQAPHGWLNDTMPGRYRRDPSMAAWRCLLDFLDRALAAPADGPRRVEWRFESDSAADYDFTKKVRLE